MRPSTTPSPNARPPERPRSRSGTAFKRRYMWLLSRPRTGKVPRASRRGGDGPRSQVGLARRPADRSGLRQRGGPPRSSSRANLSAKAARLHPQNTRASEGPSRVVWDYSRGGVRRVVSLLVVIAALGVSGCHDERELCEFCESGRIKGEFHLGGETLPGSEWIEMIQLSGPPADRCGPGACGMAYEALRGGLYWTPGKWRVIPPHVRGWIAPDPVVVIIREDELTTFEAAYRRV